MGSMLPLYLRVEPKLYLFNKTSPIQLCQQMLTGPCDGCRAVSHVVGNVLETGRRWEDENSMAPDSMCL